MENLIQRNGIHYVLRKDQYYPGLFIPAGSEQDQYELIVQQMAEGMGVNDELKETDPTKWSGLMNNIRSAAREFFHESV